MTPISESARELLNTVRHPENAGLELPGSSRWDTTTARGTSAPPAAVARDRMAQRLDETVLLPEAMKTHRKRPIHSQD